MWFVVLNAIFFHFYHSHPYPSPRPGKCCHLKKRRKIALCGRIALFYLHMIPYGVIFCIIEQKIENGRLKSIYQNWICSMLRITYIAFFAKHYFPTLSKSHLLNYPYYTIYYAIQDSMIFTTIISILQYCYSYVIHCNYIVTIIITTIYSYIYRYNLSIKIYNNQYRYKHTDSIIGMILNNTEMNIYTVYTYHNYTIINIILVYSNFFSAYHSYLLLKRCILKLYEKCITE